MPAEKLESSFPMPTDGTEINEAPQSREKLNIVLDLDQTLIAAYAIGPDGEYDHEKNREQAKKFTFHNMDGYYIVFERPGLQKFLDHAFKNYNVSVWTAASKDYALYIIDEILQHGKNGRTLDWIFFSYHCDISKKKKKASKKLEMLWEVYSLPGFTKDNTVIIDDYDEVYKSQPRNGIIAPPFEAIDKGSENDKYLDVLANALDDVRIGENGDLALGVNEKLKTAEKNKK